MQDIRERQGLRGIPLISCHLIDLPWWVSAPAAEVGRNACIGNDAHRTVSVLEAAREAE